MAQDANGVLQALVTKTTAFASASYDLKTMTPSRGLYARIVIPAYSGGGAGGTWTPTLQDSADNTTFADLTIGTPLTVGTAAVATEQSLGFRTPNRYVRLNMLNGVTTSTPTITYLADIGIARHAQR